MIQRKLSKAHGYTVQVLAVQLTQLQVLLIIVRHLEGLMEELKE